MIIPAICLSAALLFPVVDGLSWTYSRGDGSERCGYIMQSGVVIHYDPEVRHVHNVKRNPYDGYIYASFGDEFRNRPETKGQSKLKISRDGGITWHTILQNDRANFLTIDFVGRRVLLGEDSAQFNPTSRLMQYDPITNKIKEIFRLPKGYEANIWSSYKCDDEMIFYGTFTDKIGSKPSIWLYNKGIMLKMKEQSDAKKPWVGYKHKDLLKEAIPMCNSLKQKYKKIKTP